MLKQITLEEAEFFKSMGIPLYYHCAHWSECERDLWVGDVIGMREFAEGNYESYRADDNFRPVSWYVYTDG